MKKVKTYEVTYFYKERSDILKDGWTLYHCSKNQSRYRGDLYLYIKPSKSEYYINCIQPKYKEADIQNKTVYVVPGTKMPRSYLKRQLGVKITIKPERADAIIGSNQGTSLKIVNINGKEKIYTTRGIYVYYNYHDVSVSHCDGYKAKFIEALQNDIPLINPDFINNNIHDIQEEITKSEIIECISQLASPDANINKLGATTMLSKNWSKFSYIQGCIYGLFGREIHASKHPLLDNFVKEATKKGSYYMQRRYNTFLNYLQSFDRMIKDNKLNDASIEEKEILTELFNRFLETENNCKNIQGLKIIYDPFNMGQQKNKEDNKINLDNLFI